MQAGRGNPRKHWAELRDALPSGGSPPQNQLSNSNNNNWLFSHQPTSSKRSIALLIHFRISSSDDNAERPSSCCRISEVLNVFYRYMSSAQFFALKQALIWTLKDAPLTREQLDLVEVSACALATNGSATTRFEALASKVPNLGLLDRALKIIQGTLTLAVGEGDAAKLVIISEAKYA